jgi:hypothetical protein
VPVDPSVMEGGLRQQLLTAMGMFAIAALLLLL